MPAGAHIKYVNDILTKYFTTMPMICQYLVTNSMGNILLLFMLEQGREGVINDWEIVVAGRSPTSLLGIDEGNKYSIGSIARYSSLRDRKYRIALSIFLTQLYKCNCVCTISV